MNERDTSRRGALKALAVAGGCVAAAVVVVPGAQLVLAPARGAAGAARWIKTVRVDLLREGTPKRISIIADARDAFMLDKQVELGAVWLVRRGDKVDAFNVTCPHLGCAIALEDDTFSCPCHDSDFALDGARKSGPSPRDMDRLETKVEDGHVMVDFRKFRQGIPEKVEIG